MGFISDMISESARLPPTPSNEELCRLAQSGDESARGVLIVRNLPLVLKKAKRYALKGESVEDVFSDAYLGLIEAIRRYRPESGAKFSTAADFSIRQSINYERHRRAPIWVTKYARDHESTPSGEAAKKALSVKHFRLVSDPPSPELDDPSEIEPLYAALRSIPERDYAMLMQWLDGVSDYEIRRNFTQPGSKHYTKGLTAKKVKKVMMNTIGDLQVAFGRKDGRAAIAESKLNPKHKEILSAYRALLVEGNENPSARDICNHVGWEMGPLISNTINKLLRKLADKGIIPPRKLKTATTQEHIDECLKKLRADGKEPTRSDLVKQAGVTRSQITDYIRYMRRRGTIITIPQGPRTKSLPRQDGHAKDARMCAQQKAENYEMIRGMTGPDEMVYAENTRTGQVERMPAIRYAADQLAEALEWMDEEGEGLILIWNKIRYTYVPDEKSFIREKIDETRYPLHNSSKMEDDRILADRTSRPRGILRKSRDISWYWLEHRD